MYIVKFVAIITALFLFSFSSQAQAVLEDVVELKNGSVVRGKILEYRPAETIKIEIMGGSVLVYPASEVVEIRKEESKNVVNNTNNTYVPRPRPAIHNPDKGWYHYTSAKMGGGIDAMSRFAPVIGMSHSSGYFFKRAIGVGLGMGIERNGVFNMMPIYVDLRGYMMKSSASMFYSLGIGYNAVLASKGNGWMWGEIGKSSGGYYIHPALGVRFSSRNRVHTVLDFGFTMQSAFNTEHKTWNWETNMQETAILQMPFMLRPTLRVGIIF